jgi:hypothetical protein
MSAKEPEGKNPLEGLGLDRMIPLKWILKIKERVHRLD